MMSNVPPSHPTLIRFRNAFISGALLLAPLAVTLWAFSAIIKVVGGTFRPLYGNYIPQSLQRLPFFWDLLATLLVFLLVTALGFLSNYVLGKYFFGVGERLIQRIPGLGSLYNSVRQIVATFGAQKRNLFTKVVMLEFPRKGLWVIGFLTSKAQGEPHVLTGAEHWTVFVPTTPNPTSGFLIIVPRDELIELEMSVGDGMKMIFSGGTVIPPGMSVQAPVEAVR
jgi:uncharacterized membrane protein